MSLNQEMQNIVTRKDLSAFVRSLKHDLDNNPGEWENSTLPSYLEALAAWIEDMDGYFWNQGVDAPNEPNWRLIGQALLAAKFYE